MTLFRRAFGPWAYVSVVVFAVIGIGFPLVANAAVASGKLTLTTRKAVVFKDGYALLIKDARGTADASGRVFTLDVPDSAVLGSFWALSKKQEILAMHAEFTEDWKRVEAPLTKATSNLSTLFNRISDEQVVLTTTHGKKVSGKLLGRTRIEDRPFVLIQPVATAANPTPQPITVNQSEIVAIHSAALGGYANMDPTFVRAKRLSFSMGIEQAGKPVTLTLVYFTPGIRWIPTYRVSGKLEDTAAMALQAEILNHREDLQSVTLDLVVGVPHFRFRDVISPLSLEAKLRNTLAQAAPQLMGQMTKPCLPNESANGDTSRMRRPRSRTSACQTI